jgi:CHRD domain-containing protein
MNEHHCLKRLPLLAFTLLLFSGSCRKTGNPGTFTTGFWSIDLTTINCIPGDSTRKDHAYAVLNLMNDSTLHYDIYFGAIASGDAPVSVQLYQGAPAENGPLVLPLTGVHFNGQNSAVGSLPVSRVIIDSLLSPTAPHYLLINSKQVPGGLVRGQMGMKITYGLDIAMNGNNENPPVSTTATGDCILRLLSDNVTLYYNVQVSGVPAGDMLTSAAIRRTSDNSVLVQLASSPSDFNKSNSKALASSAVASFQSDKLYIDIRSMNYPNGLISGMIR